MKTEHPDQCRASRKEGLTLIELIGVMAVLSLLSAIIVPVIIKELDAAAVSAETDNLANIVNNLGFQVMRSNSIPSEATWAAAAGTWLSQPTAKIMTNARNYNRLLVIDTNGWLAQVLPTTGYFTQTVAGANNPNNARVMVVTSLTTNLPAALVSRPSSAVFGDLWNTLPGKLPTNSMWAKANWKGRGDDLLIQRLNLQPFFHRVILVNGSAGLQASYSINGSSPTLIPLGGAGLDAYFIDGTALGLYDTNVPPVLQSTAIIKNDYSLLYENLIWRDQLFLGLTLVTNSPPSDAQGIATAFFSQAPPGGWSGNANKWGGTPQSVLGLINSYMDGYATWAAMVPPFSYTGSGNTTAAQYPPAVEIESAISAFSKGGSVVP